MKATDSFTTADHWRHFAQFCRWELAAGGPDPQISLVGWMSRNTEWVERVWRGGCYISVYNVPFAEVLWDAWPWQRIVAEPAALLPWLRAHWAQIVTRVERRCVRRPEWLAEFFLGYVEFVNRLHREWPFSGTYDQVWAAALQVPRLGRYVALKLLEYLRRYADLPELDPRDIRPKGAWSPRATLAVLFPEHAAALMGNDSFENLETTNVVVERCRARLEDEFHVRVNVFQIQVLLCEYRESYEGGRQYPGRSLDSELGYARKAAQLWPDHSTMLWKARRALFPSAHLGELHGWGGARNVLGKVLRTHGYTWTDLRYDFRATEAANTFATPVPRV